MAQHEIVAELIADLATPRVIGFVEPQGHVEFF